MTELSNFNNIYANLAQSSYYNRKKNFPYDALDKENQEKIDAGESVKINYGSPVGKVYLQPDPTVKTYKEIDPYMSPDAYNGYTNINTYQKLRQ